jgi:CheY-like chemotaxis protein
MQKLLYVEDEYKKPIETDPFVSILREAGFDVEVADSGEKAWQKLSEKEYDVLILDIMLPHKGKKIPENIPRYRTGIYLLESLRDGRFPKNKDIPVVVVSAICDLEDMRKIKDEMRPDKYLEKPIRPPVLLEAVEKAVRAGK